MPFVETVVSAVLGAVIGLIDQKWSSALIAFAIGLILSFSRLAFTQTLKRKLVPLARLSRLVDINRQIPYPAFLEMVNVYSRIIEPEFQRVKDAVIEDAAQHLRQLAEQRKSRELDTGEYYLWLFSMLEHQTSGEVWAVSTMNPLEWIDTQAEREFLRLNKEVVSRGVKLTRVFIVDRDKADILPTSSSVAWHFSTRGVRPFVAIKEEIQKADPRLLSEIRDGFIAFDQRVAMIDVFAVDGSARGYVTTNPIDIQRLHGQFDELMKTFGELGGLEAEPRPVVSGLLAGGQSDGKADPALPSSPAVDSDRPTGTSQP